MATKQKIGLSSCSRQEQDDNERDKNSRADASGALLIQLGSDILCHVCCFCTLNDLYTLRRCSVSFREAVKLNLSLNKSLHFSMLVPIRIPTRGKQNGKKRKLSEQTTFRNTSSILQDCDGNKLSEWIVPTKQEECIASMLKEAALTPSTINKSSSVVAAGFGNGTSNNVTATKPARLRNLDLTNLRHITGEMIFPAICMVPPSDNTVISSARTYSLANSIETLNLSACTKLDPQYLIQAMEDVTRTTLSASSSLFIEGIVGSPSQFQSLRHLYFSGCRRLTKDKLLSTLSHFNLSIHDNNVSHRHQLETLHLDGCSQKIDDECIHKICTSLPNLKSLNLEGLENITDVGMESIIFNNNRLACLEYLNVNGCRRIYCSFLRQSGRRLLEQLLPLTTSLNGLIDYESLLVRLSRNSTDNVFVTSSSFYLESICLSTLPGGSLTYFSVLSKGNLREVDISGCESVTDDDIKVLVLTCGNSIQSLEMRGCNIGNDAISVLGNNNYGGCSSLVFLDISACFHVGDEGIKSLCVGRGGCPFLTTLKLANLSLLSDDAVIDLGSLTNLVLLDINSCSKITSHAITQGTNPLKNLIDLDVRNTAGARNIGSCLSSDILNNLAILNGRRCTNYHKRGRAESLPPCNTSTTTSVSSPLVTSSSCLCTSRSNSQRLRTGDGAKPQRMYHCSSCNLLPSFYRGFCSACAKTCHAKHSGVFLGSVTIFYCDCAFGFSQQKEHYGA